MTKEQEEAIEMLEDIENNTWTTKYIMSSDSKKAETVLNMLKTQQREIKTLTQTNRSYKGMINKKDKQIDLIAKYLAINGVERDICNEKRIKENCKNVTVDNITVHRCKECIKQYFERKANDEKN